MDKYIYEIKTKKQADGTIVAENSFIYTPKIKFSGKKTKWLKDIIKSK